MLITCCDIRMKQLEAGIECTLLIFFPESVAIYMLTYTFFESVIVLSYNVWRSFKLFCNTL